MCIQNYRSDKGAETTNKLFRNLRERFLIASALQNRLFATRTTHKHRIEIQINSAANCKLAVNVSVAYNEPRTSTMLNSVAAVVHGF